jgi:catechol 2,3-dioxygenase-like lactoylglutathione lyase family enzyme
MRFLDANRGPDQVRGRLSLRDALTRRLETRIGLQDNKRRQPQEISMIDHIGFPVSDYERAKAFYLKALAPLGYSLVMEVTQEAAGDYPAAGFGADGKPDFWIGGEGGLNKPMHVAILAKDHATVDAFYRAAMAAGGRDNGAPGIRAHYHPNYYGAFVLDPDGHNIEAVCHVPA